jgi:hypothetical protein
VLTAPHLRDQCLSTISSLQKGYHTCWFPVGTFQAAAAFAQCIDSTGFNVQLSSKLTPSVLQTSGLLTNAYRTPHDTASIPQLLLPSPGTMQGTMCYHQGASYIRSAHVCLVLSACRRPLVASSCSCIECHIWCAMSPEHLQGTAVHQSCKTSGMCTAKYAAWYRSSIYPGSCYMRCREQGVFTTVQQAVASPTCYGGHGSRSHLPGFSEYML